MEEVLKYSLFGKYTPDALDLCPATRHDGVDKKIQSRAPNLYEFLHGLFGGSAATLEGHDATCVMLILSVICFTRHQKKCNFLPEDSSQSSRSQLVDLVVKDHETEQKKAQGALGSTWNEPHPKKFR